MTNKEQLRKDYIRECLCPNFEKIDTPRNEIVRSIFEFDSRLIDTNYPLINEYIKAWCGYKENIKLSSILNINFNMHSLLLTIISKELEPFKEDLMLSFIDASYDLVTKEDPYYDAFEDPVTINVKKHYTERRS